MIASKCILNTFPGNDESHAPLTNAGGWAVNSAAAVSGVSTAGREVPAAPGLARQEVQCLERSGEQGRPTPSPLPVNST